VKYHFKEGLSKFVFKMSMRVFNFLFDDLFFLVKYHIWKDVQKIKFCSCEIVNS